MKKTVERQELIVWILALGYFVFFSFASLFLYRNLVYEDFDLAVHAQTMWNLCHGSGFSSILGVHFLANHFIPFFYVLKYVYAIFKTPILLLVLQSLALAAGVVLSYKLARRTLDRGWAMIMALTFFFYPGIGYANLFEFHPTTLAVPFLFLTIFAYTEGRFLRFILLTLISMSFQENICLAVGMLGVVAFVQKKGIGWIAAPVLLAAAWFYMAVIKIQPAYNRGTIEFFSIYSHIASTPLEMVKTLLTNPWTLLSCLLSLSAALYIFSVFAPLLFMPFLGWRYALVVVLFLLQHLLSSRQAERQMTYHYLVEMAPFLIWATIDGIRIFHNRYRQHYVSLGLMFCFVICFFVTTVLTSPYFAMMDRWESFLKSHRLVHSLKMVSAIPEEAPVVATFRFLPLLSQRKDVFSFHHVYMGTYTLSSKTYYLPTATRYALLEMDDGLSFGFETPMSKTTLKRFWEESDWEAVDSVLDTILLRKGKKDFSKLYEINPARRQKPSMLLRAYTEHKEIKLEGFDMALGKNEHTDEIEMTFYWTALKNPAERYDFVITFVGARGRTVYEYHHNLCYRFYPTTSWRQGDRIVEKIWFPTPLKLPRESMEMRVGLVSTTQPRIEKFKGPLKQKIDRYGRVTLDTFDPT